MKKEKCEKAGRFGICPYVTAQQILQGKWVILIMHELESGPRRFGELQRSIDVTQATLTAQLRRMEEEGIVTRTVYPEVPPHVEYTLTQIGQEFQPVLDSIAQWGDKYIAYLQQRKGAASRPGLDGMAETAGRPDHTPGSDKA